MKKFIPLVLLLLSGCIPITALPAGVMSSKNCDVAGTGSLSGSLIGSSVNISFQCSSSVTGQGPAAATNALRANAVGGQVQSQWPIPPSPAPMPVLR